MVHIRRFTSSDRQRLRQICCDVADQGEPIENFFHDREFAANLLINYYTDYEPEHTFVAELDNQVVGYVNGCLDNRRYGLVLIFLIVPLTFIQGLLRGTYFYRQFWQMFWAMLRNWRRSFQWRRQSFDSHQGHIHIGIAKDFRGQGIGEELVQRLLIQAKEKGLEQITASVHDGNAAGCLFFEHLGFKPQSRYPMVMFNGTAFDSYYSILYVKNLV